MGRKELNGQITVFAALVFGVIVSLLVVLIESAVTMGARTKMNMAVNLGVQSLFSQYSRPVLDRYEVFGGVFEEDEQIRSLLYQYIKNNVDSASNGAFMGKRFSPYDIKLSDIKIDQKQMLTDQQGKFFYDEITDYMKYGQFTSTILSFIPNITDSQNSDDLKQVNESVEKRQKEAGAIDALILKLLMYVEGVQTNSSGLKQSHGKPVAASYFVKKICPGGIAFGQTGVSNSIIYNAVSGHYYDVGEKLGNLKGDLDFIKYVYSHPATKGMFIDTGFRANAFVISTELANASTKITQSLNVIDQIDKEMEKLKSKLGETNRLIQSKQGKLDAKILNAYEEEMKMLENYTNGSMNQLCNLADVKSKLLACKSSIDLMKSSVDTLAFVPMDIDTIDNVYGMIDQCIEVCRNYPGPTIVFNYDGLSLGKGKEISELEKIGGFFSGNVYKLVVEDPNAVSTKKVNFSDLSSQKCGVQSGGNSLSLSPEKLYKDFLYNCYSDMKFSNFSKPNTEGLLSYEQEYILGKSMSDKENLNDVIQQLVNLRFMLDFAYIICDTGKKLECESMATLLLGFTGLYVVIKVGQYLLLSAWAYAEAISDVKILVNGGKVPFLKTTGNWKTTLADVVASKITGDSGNSSTGFDYSQYLQILMLMEDKNKKIFRTMDMMEINMIKAGYSHIRMYRYVYSVNGSVNFFYRRNKYEYEQKFSFAY